MATHSTKRYVLFIKLIERRFRKMGLFTFLVEIGKYVEKAYNFYQKYIAEKDEKPGVLKLLEEMCATLEEVKDAVLSEIPQEIKETRLADLEGDVIGLVTNFREYDIYDKDAEPIAWEIAKERLRDAVDRAAGVLGDLESEIGRCDLDQDIDLNQAIKVFGLYATLIPVRALAMTELARSYQMNEEEHILSMFAGARDLAKKLYPRLREKSDSRFSVDIVELRGEPWNGGFMIRIGYRFEGRFLQIDEFPPNRPSNKVRDRVRKVFEEHKDKAFSEYGGLALDTLLKLPPYRGTATLRSTRYPSRVIVCAGNEPTFGVITNQLQNVSAKDQAIFKILPGLEKEVYCSLESSNMEGFYLNATPTGALNLVISKNSKTNQYKHHATFKIVPSLSGRPFPNVSIESYSFPGKYVYDMGPSDFFSHVVQIGSSDSNEFKKRATFSIDWVEKG